MATPVTLPALGESVTEGTVTRWLKQVGDSVAVDEALLEISTDKVDTEIPSPIAGTLLEIKVAEDETVAIGAELATIGESESEQSDDQGTNGSANVAAPQEAEPPQGPPPESTQQSQPTEEPATEVTTDDVAQPAEDAGTGSSTGTPVTLPALGESVTEGTVTRWLKQVGDSVAVDEALLEISTDKVDTEIPSPIAGTLLEIKVAEDETVAIGAELATIGDSDGGETPEQPEQPEQSEQPEQPEQSEQPEPPEQPESPQPAPTETPQAQEQQSLEQSPPAQRPPDPTASRREDQAPSYVTPLVRKLAAQHQVDLSRIVGTGVGGRIRKQDVLAAAQEAKPQPPEAGVADESARGTSAAGAPTVDVSPLRGSTEKLSRLRKTIAARMLESLQVSAQLTTVVEVDVTAIARLRDQVKNQFEQREGVRLSFLPFFAKAAVDALKTYPMVNASIDTDAGTVTYHGAEHLGVAVDTERGLLVPVIKDAGDLSIAGLARKIADLAGRTRDSKITPDELSGGTFTLTNTGSRGALFDTPIINQPQVAILGTGSVVKRAVVIDDDDLGETIAIRRMVYLALTYDHRIVDGADAARFLTAVKQRLEEARFAAELGL